MAMDQSDCLILCKYILNLVMNGYGYSGPSIIQSSRKTMPDK